MSPTTDNEYTPGRLAERMREWYGTDKTRGQNWVDPEPENVMDIVKHEIAKRTISRNIRVAQLKKQRQLAPARGEPFCPVVSYRCERWRHNDVNCSRTKARGCKALKISLQNENPSAHITSEYIRDYLKRETQSR